MKTVQRQLNSEWGEYQNHISTFNWAQWNDLAATHSSLACLVNDWSSTRLKCTLFADNDPPPTRERLFVQCNRKTDSVLYVVEMKQGNLDLIVEIIFAWSLETDPQ